MLELRPICENCATLLPPESTEARICSFECTFCRTCAEGILKNVCPNCGGGFVPRPIRPQNNWRNESYLSKYPATTEKKHRPVDLEGHKHFAQKIYFIPPEKR